MKKNALINIEIPDWMNEAITARALEEQTTKNAVVLKALSDVIAQRASPSGTNDRILKEFPLVNRLADLPGSVGEAD